MSSNEARWGMEIIGHSSVVPENIVSNEQIAGKINQPGIDAAWITQMTGIKERPHVDPEKGENTASLATAAGRLAIERAGIDPEGIDVLMIATSTSPKQLPATVNEVQDELGIKKALCFDIGAACSGFVHGMTTAHGYLAGYSRVKRVMLIGADAVSTITDPIDRDTAPIFADGAGAMIFEKVEGSNAGILGTAWDNNGSERNLFTVEHGGHIKMQGSALAKAITRTVTSITSAALEDAKLTADDIDHNIMHQSNGRLIDIISRRIGIDASKIYTVIETLGNSSAATVPSTYDRVRAEGRIKKGEIVMFSGVAIGIGGSCVIMRM